MNPEARENLNKSAPVTAANLTHHVLVCTGSSCSNQKSQETLNAFYSVLKEKNLLYGKRGTLEGRILVSTCGSVGLCAIGPAVLIYPEGVWYYGVTPDVVPEIVESHLIQNKPVERYMAMTISSSNVSEFNT